MWGQSDSGTIGEEDGLGTSAGERLRRCVTAYPGMGPSGRSGWWKGRCWAKRRMIGETGAIVVTSESLPLSASRNLLPRGFPGTRTVVVPQRNVPRTNTFLEGHGACVCPKGGFGETEEPQTRRRHASIFPPPFTTAKAGHAWPTVLRIQPCPAMNRAVVFPCAFNKRLRNDRTKATVASNPLPQVSPRNPGRNHEHVQENTWWDATATGKPAAEESMGEGCSRPFRGGVGTDYNPWCCVWG